ncbi:hypothetical protein [Streptomyces sp. KS 21]|uniref:hypothetical protein n=1 Tax=Streptomyces sp. KS 21 TaxID=2485150 RepID=UPI001062F563|nr:hypothetical protein [Streptomyces sp. KS 21]TDU73475.1 hypothetical protein EDD91_0017 [Streptomyces sp. KS 21]
MRTRLVGFTTAAALAFLGPAIAYAATPAATPADAHAAAPSPTPSVGGQACEDGGGTVQYKTGFWVCIGGEHDKKPIE